MKGGNKECKRQSERHRNRQMEREIGRDNYYLQELIMPHNKKKFMFLFSQFALEKGNAE